MRIKYIFIMIFLLFVFTGCELLGDGASTKATITFETNGGTEVVALEVSKGETMLEPTQPTKENYVFSGWFMDEDCTSPYDFSKAIEDDMTLYSKWVGVSHTVIFYDYDNTIISEIVVPYNEEITVPTVTERTGYEFSGWDQEVPTLMPLSDLTFVAEYEPIMYKLSILDPNGIEVDQFYFVYGSEVDFELNYRAPYGILILGYEEQVPTTMPAEDISLTLITEDDYAFFGPTIALWDFSQESQLDDWTKYEGVMGAFPIAVSIDQGAMKVELTAINNTWEPRLDTQDIPFEQTYEYFICFDAKASLPGKSLNIQIGELLDTVPWFIDFKPGYNVHYTLTDEWEPYCFFLYMFEENPRGGILFEFGSIPNYDMENQGLLGTVWIDNVIVRGGPNTSMSSIIPIEITMANEMIIDMKRYF